MLDISPTLSIPLAEIEFSAIRSQGAGGQNVNKVASAIHLRFNIRQSSLPEEIKSKLLAYQDDRITKDGVIVIKAQRFRTQAQNKEDALHRLRALIKKATHIKKARKATKPTQASKQKRLESKSKRGKLKASRQVKKYFDE